MLTIGAFHVPSVDGPIGDPSVRTTVVGAHRSRPTEGGLASASVVTSSEPPLESPFGAPPGPVGPVEDDASEATPDDRPTAPGDGTRAPGDLFADRYLAEIESDPDPGPAPAVVVVMVAHDPGDWFAETLTSIAAQDYPALSVLVVDAASTDPADLRGRVAAVLPDAHLRRLDENPGFAMAADEALVAVQGASFLLFCHDDVRLAPDAVRLLVEEAFRSNAGIVGPKLVDWSDDRRLLSVGMGADRFGHPAPYVERGDLDQEQHDAVRDVFYIPGAATLVRADLFEALGGFDPQISFHGEDLDLCWRAHVAGARVIVNPAAVVAHLEALALRRPVDDRRRLQARHRLRTMRASDTWATRVRAVPEALVLAMAEIVQAVVLGHFRRARDIASAWTWNIRNASTTRRRRAVLAEVRRVPDREVHAFQSRGSARLSLFMRTRVARSDAAAGGRALVTNLRQARATTSFVVWVLILAFLLFGGRELVLGGVPVVGDFVRFLSPGQMFERWTSAWQSVGLGTTAPAPTGLGLLGSAGAVLFGATGLLRALLLLGLWPLGAVGMWRLTRPIVSTRARLVSTILYVVVPLAANAMAQGQWGALAAYASFPWVLSQLAAATGLSPFGPIGDDPGPGVRERPLLHRTVALALVLALAAMVEPSVALLGAGASVALVVGGVLTGQVAGSRRVLAAGFGSTLLALVLLAPWSFGLVTGWDSVLGTGSNGGFPLRLGDVLRFGTGPFGTGVIGWLPLVTAALPLFIGRRWRLGWAVRGWVLAAGGFGLVWAMGEGWLVDVLPPASVLLVPAAAGLSLAAGLGMASFEVDLPGYRVGWRQALSVVAAVAFVVSLGPALLSTFSGRWDLPRGDYQRSLSFLSEGTDDGWYRVLWLGDASSIPTGSWHLDAPSVGDLGPGRELSFATTGPTTPSIAELWPGSDGGATGQLASVLQQAAQDGTARLGAQLAPMAVRYVVVPLAPAPDPYARSRAAAPDALISLLDAQLDLASMTVNPGVRVYRNAAWIPGVTLLPSGSQLPDGDVGPAERITTRFARSVPSLTDDQSFADASGGLAGPGLLYAAFAGDHWRLTIDGSEASRSPALGWAQAFDAGSGGQARLWYDTPLLHRLTLIGQVLLWLVAIAYLLRVRARTDEGPLLLIEPEPEPEIPDPEPPEPVVADRSTIFDAADPRSIDEVLAAITGTVPAVDESEGDRPPPGPQP